MKRWFKSKKQKREENNAKRIAAFNSSLASIHQRTDDKNPNVSFKHSGQTGDIIYSIPAMLGLANGKMINLYINLDVEINLSGLPYGNKMFTKEAFDLLLPLLKIQSYFGEIEVYKGQHIDYDLDKFRTLPFIPVAGCLQRHWFHLFNTTFDLSQTWIKNVPLNDNFKNSLVVSRSFRYRNPTIDYRFLSNYEDVKFIGTDAEYQDFKQQVPECKRIIINDFLEMAIAIFSSKVFIGNQSFPFSLAEAMKCKRVLEICPETPHVIPHGENGFDFYFQKYFEAIIKNIYQNG